MDRRKYCNLVPPRNPPPSTPPTTFTRTDNNGNDDISYFMHNYPEAYHNLRRYSLRKQYQSQINTISKNNQYDNLTIKDKQNVWQKNDTFEKLSETFVLKNTYNGYLWMCIKCNMYCSLHKAKEHAGICEKSVINKDTLIELNNILIQVQAIKRENQNLVEKDVRVRCQRSFHALRGKYYIPVSTLSDAGLYMVYDQLIPLLQCVCCEAKFPFLCNGDICKIMQAHKDVKDLCSISKPEKLKKSLTFIINREPVYKKSGLENKVLLHIVLNKIIESKTIHKSKYELWENYFLTFEIKKLKYSLLDVIKEEEGLVNEEGSKLIDEQPHMGDDNPSCTYLTPPPPMRKLQDQHTICVPSERKPTKRKSFEQDPSLVDNIVYKNKKTKIEDVLEPSEISPIQNYLKIPHSTIEYKYTDHDVNKINDDSNNSPHEDFNDSLPDLYIVPLGDDTTVSQEVNNDSDHLPPHEDFDDDDNDPQPDVPLGDDTTVPQEDDNFSHDFTDNLSLPDPTTDEGNSTRNRKGEENRRNERVTETKLKSKEYTKKHKETRRKDHQEEKNKKHKEENRGKHSKKREIENNEFVWNDDMTVESTEVDTEVDDNGTYMLPMKRTISPNLFSIAVFTPTTNAHVVRAMSTDENHDINLLRTLLETPGEVVTPTTNAQALTEVSTEENYEVNPLRTLLETPGEVVTPTTNAQALTEVSTEENYEVNPLRTLLETPGEVVTPTTNAQALTEVSTEENYEVNPLRTLLETPGAVVTPTMNEQVVTAVPIEENYFGVSAEALSKNNEFLKKSNEKEKKKRKKKELRKKRKEKEKRRQKRKRKTKHHIKRKRKRKCRNSDSSSSDSDSSSEDSDSSSLDSDSSSSEVRNLMPVSQTVVI